MKNYLPSSILKKNAREQLFGKLGTVIGAFLLHMLCFMPVYVLSDLFRSDSVISILASLAVSIGLELLVTAILSAGEGLIYLKVACNQEVAVTDLFAGYKGMIPKIIGIRIIPVLVSNILALPVSFLNGITYSMVPDMQNFSQKYFKLLLKNDINGLMKLEEELLPTMPWVFGTLGAMLLYALIMIALKVMFSQTNFLIWDFPDKSAGEIIKSGFRVMKGNWGRYIYVMLSFIPWYLCGFITCYISFAWTFPYVNATYANFYIDLMKNYEKTKDND